MATIKIAASSDFHGHLPEFPQCDMIIIAGDICPATNHTTIYQQQWIDNIFNPYIDEQVKKSGAMGAIITLGNHDYIDNHNFYKSNSCICLLDNTFEYKGLKIWGCPHTKKFFDWNYMMEECDLDSHHHQIPLDTDIIIAHSPPYGFGDAVPRKNNNCERVGSSGLLNFIVHQQPKLVICGHIHCNQETRVLGKTTIANVAYVDEHYQPYYPPQVFEVEI